MLEQIISLVKEYGETTVVSNPDVPNEQNEAVLAEAGKTVAGGLQNILAGGGFENILSLFGGQSGSQQNGMAGLMKNPIVSMMVGNLINKLVGKYNMNPQQASNVSASLIPNVLNQLIQRTQDPNNSSFTMDSLIQSLTGGNVSVPTQSGSGGGLQDLLNQFTGGGNNGGSGIDIANIINQITNQSQSQIQNQQGSGGLMDMIKGFLK